MPRLKTYNIFALSGIHIAYEDSYDFETTEHTLPITQKRRLFRGSWILRSVLHVKFAQVVFEKSAVECLELSFIVGLNDSEDVSDPPVPENRLVLPHVTRLELGYMGLCEAQNVLRQFDFPSLRGLTLRNSQERAESSSVLVSLMTFLQVEQLSSLNLVEICVLPAGFPEVETAAEESLPVVLEVWVEGRSVNLSGLKELVVQMRGPGSVAIVLFLRERLEQGTINKVYAGPVLERMLLALKDDVQEEVSSLGYLQLAKESRVFFF
ncbi:uncharacterized protein ARMOST_21492 [Armillaria ostoyae]|uniref:Uncharacterized protein n=1 Tax=Armillaria ostoyae TaxID=47428 RepID=A0A284SA95_ARMOS|nr:uncharacterized protein ARMOST_21492 [Armillaria ostoyae]